MEQEEARRTFTTRRRAAAEEPRHVARIRSSPDESLLKIFTDAREGKKNKRKNRGRAREGPRARRF